MKRKEVRVGVRIAYQATYSDRHLVTEEGVLACTGKAFKGGPGTDQFDEDLDYGGRIFGITCRTCLWRLGTGAARIEARTANPGSRTPPS